MCPHSYNGPDRRDQPHFDPAPNLCYLLLQLELGERFEQTYIHRLYEALEVVEPREMQAPEGEA